VEAYHEEMMAIMDAHYEKMRAISKKCLGTTEAKKEPAPEQRETVEEPQEVPEGATDEETLGATEDRASEQRLAVWRHGQLKKRDQVNGGPRQKFAAVRGRFTRRSVPALRKGGLRKGPGKKCRSGRKGQEGIPRREDSVTLVRERTMPTERPPLIGEVVPTFADIGCRVVSATDAHGR
jgi:hypothetical protein